MKNYILILVLLAFAVPLLSTSVLAVYNVTNSSSFTYDEDITHLYNISVNNSDAGSISNITAINITIPAVFAFVSGSNDSNIANFTFTNTSTTLSWRNDTHYLINGSGIQFHFWFNATAGIPGNYNISVRASNASGQYTESNLSVRILDIAPIITNFTGGYGGYAFRPTEDNATYVFNISVNNTNAGSISNITEVNITLPLTFTLLLEAYNTSINSNYNFSNTSRVLSWFNYTHYLINGSGNKAYFWFNATASTPGIYNISVRASNASGQYSEENLSVSVSDTTVPNGTISLPATFANYSALTMSFALAATDNYAISSCWFSINEVYNYTMDNTTASDFNYTNTSIANGTYSAKFFCNDTSNNINLTIGNRTFSINSTIVAVDDDDDDGSSGGTTSNNSYWYVVNYPTASQTNAGYNKDLATRHSIRVKINNSYYYVGVVALTSKKATINVSNASNSYQNVFEKGEEKKFDTNKDGYYDVFVRVSNVSGLRANVTVWTIFEKVTATPIVNTTNNTGNFSGNTPAANGSSGGADLGAAQNNAPKAKSLIAKAATSIWFWIVFTIIILIVAAFLYEYFLNKKYYQKGYRKKWD